MTHPINYAYYPLGKVGQTDYDTLWNRCKSIEYAWNRDVKGVPVPFTGRKKWRKHANGSGVSASSRVLSHYYADEGEKGSYVRKLVRTRERQMWRDEWLAEQFELDEFDYDVNEWFESEPLMWDWYDDDDWYRFMDDVECPYCNGPCTL